MLGSQSVGGVRAPEEDVTSFLQRQGLVIGHLGKRRELRHPTTSPKSGVP